MRTDDPLLERVLIFGFVQSLPGRSSIATTEICKRVSDESLGMTLE